jgi:hypothetical protein
LKTLIFFECDRDRPFVIGIVIEFVIGQQGDHKGDRDQKYAAMTASIPDERARMLVFVIARAMAIYRGDKEPTLADRRLAAAFLTQPGAPLERLCVQVRLACSAGNSPAGVEVRAP